jgi:hypothetical protein
MAGVAQHGLPGISCSTNSACLTTLDKATARMHLAAAAQLCGLRSSELRRCWQLDSFFNAVLVISLKSRCLARRSTPRRTRRSLCSPPRHRPLCPQEARA